MENMWTRPRKGLRSSRSDQDDKSSQIVTKCLQVSVILRTIFQHFSTAELRRLARVNKFWSFEARSLLRARESLVLTINKYNGCQDLRDLASALRRTKAITRVLPVSGLAIHLKGSDGFHTDSCAESASAEMSEVSDEILGQITWKTLVVVFGTQWTEKFINCPGFSLMKKLLEKFGPVLEVLELTFPSEGENILQQVFQSSSFPRLAILRIQHSKAPNDGYANWIKTIVARAPGLELLQTYTFVNLNANLLEGSSAFHIADHPYSPSLDEIPESVDFGKFRMTRMELTEIRQDFQLDRFNRITSRLLEASRSTLSSMHIDVMFLAPLAIYGVSLDNVRILKINLNQPGVDDPQPDLLRLAKSFDFTRTFPSLEYVRPHFYSDFDYSVDGIQEMIEGANALFVQPLPDRAANIKTLNIECLWEIDGASVLLLADMFPHVEDLTIEGTEIPYGRIWESWPHLKSLLVNNIPMRNVVENLDSVFCGLFEEEIAQLREQDNEYLRKVNIVPVMPSITCLKDLKTLKLVVGETFNVQGSLNYPTHVLSKVTELTAFQRCPALRLTLIMSDGGTLDHVRT